MPPPRNSVWQRLLQWRKLSIRCFRVTCFCVFLSCCSPWASGVFLYFPPLCPPSINGKHRQECLLRNFHVSYGFHPLFTFFLFFQKFSFPSNIAAITLGGYIFCNWTDRFSCNNPASYCRLQYNLKQVS